MDKLRNKAVDQLFRAILDLNTLEECYTFFEDLCTIKEIQDLSQRMEVAAMLNEGKSYQEITKATGVSTATICRVNRCLVYGNGGYKMVLGRGKGKETE